MEKGGAVDQALYAVLNLLNQTWLGLVTAFVASFVVAYLARRSPKSDWEFIKEGPDKLLTGAFLLMASLKSVPRLVVPQGDFVCDSSTDPTTGIQMTGACRYVSGGPVTVAYDYTFGDMVREFFASLVASAAIGAVGAAAGVLSALLVNRLSAPSTAVPPAADGP